MNEEQAPLVIDWKDLLLIISLCFVLFWIFWLALEWAAQQWSLDWLHERGRRGSVTTLLAALGGSWVGFRVASSLGFKPIKRAANLTQGRPSHRGAGRSPWGVS